ncbi:hypothetical protein BJD16_01045 [Aeromonas sobria]|uniref:IS5/IS1182 family transposase n=1 Tax=Aeromonas sobria TaxID=646 RepID=A0A1S2DA16_AERSO|nr:hypothetical protein BJD16_01045 [Aeromonas sobria]
MGKSLPPITNWPQYNRPLINRGELTFWINADAMNNWFHHNHHGRYGHSQNHLMLKGTFCLTL